MGTLKKPTHPHPIEKSIEQWMVLFQEIGEQPFRAKQVFEWIHQKRVLDPENMTNLSTPLRQKLKEHFKTGFSRTLGLEKTHLSKDQTRKLLLKTQDGLEIETVLIPQEHRSANRTSGITKVTQCISTQVGCAMGCTFCASGVAGLKRNLTAEEILSQVFFAYDSLQENEKLSHLVFMGMGEPLHNFDALKRTIEILIHTQGHSFSPKRVTVSTSGLVPQIEALGEAFDGKIGLAISLHAPEDQTREKIMPINRKYPIATLMEALRNYPLPRGQKITFEYTLIQGKNDTLENARKLAKLLKNAPAKINLIPMNPIEASTLQAPNTKSIQNFQNELKKHGVLSLVRKQRGDDVAAACGQLALQKDLVSLKKKSIHKKSR